MKIISTLTSNRKRLFFVDGIGAILSALLLTVLAQYESISRMPQHVLYPLAAIACVFAIYSISCYYSVRNNHKPFLRTIAIANLLYCCITLILVAVFFQQLTMAGLLYFVFEIIIICSLVYIEFKAVLKN